MMVALGCGKVRPWPLPPRKNTDISHFVELMPLLFLTLKIANYLDIWKCIAVIKGNAANIQTDVAMIAQPSSVGSKPWWW